MIMPLPKMRNPGKKQGGTCVCMGIGGKKCWYDLDISIRNPSRDVELITKYMIPEVRVELRAIDTCI